MNVFERFKLKGRTALVTGGGRGLGWGVSQALAAAGCDLVLVGRNAETLERACTQLAERFKVKVVSCAADLVQREEARRAAREALRRCGAIDILIHNAGLASMEPVDRISDGAWDTLHGVTLDAARVLTGELAPSMKERRWGRIVYVSSAAAFRSYAVGHGAYSALKAGLLGFAQTAAVELGPFGVTVNCIAPGAFLTDMATESPEARAAFETSNDAAALGRYGDPDELAAPVLLLASDGGSYITGTCLVVDGGFGVKAR